MLVLCDLLIPRYYLPTTTKATYIRLHGFCDASESDYAAVVYMRSEDDHGQSHLALVAAKIKEAPVKRKTIPRLELCGALILASYCTTAPVFLRFPLTTVQRGWTA